MALAHEPDQEIDVQTAPVIHTHTRIYDTLENANIKQEAESQSNEDVVKFSEYMKSSGIGTHVIDIKTEVIGSDDYYSGNLNIKHGPILSDGDIGDQIAPTDVTAIKPEPVDEPAISNGFVIEIDTCKDEYYEKYGYPTNYSNVSLQNSEIGSGHTSCASDTQPCIVGISEINSTYPHITIQRSVQVHAIGPIRVIGGPPETPASKLPRRGKSSKINQTHVCPVCGVAFSSNSVLNRHTLTHTGVKPYTCSVCGVGFAQKGTLLSHTRTHTGMKPYRCSVCGIGFAQTSNLNIHMRIHTGVKPHKYSVCTVGFTVKGNLAEPIHTGDKPYTCSVCGAGFTLKDDLKTHARTHNSEKPHKCSVCERCFTRRHHLTGHMRTHTGEKPYKCKICGDRFAQASHMQRHTMKHTGEKSHMCSVCGGGFTQKSHLRIHTRIHTGWKPHNCSVCNSSFAQKGNLTRHMSTHFSEKP